MGKGQKIFTTKCKRCGKMIASSRWSMTHSLGQICSGCITPEEKQQIIDDQIRIIMGKSNSNPIHVISKAAKRHNCAYCGGPIQPEENYYSVRGSYGGRWKTLHYHIKCHNKAFPRWSPIRPSKSNPESSLYESFHGVAPIRKVKGFYEPPPKELLTIGTLSQINYKPVRGQHSNTEFYHKSGDDGKTIHPSNLILATDKQGKNLYLIRKNRNGKFPVFTDRGIIG